MHAGFSDAHAHALPAHYAPRVAGRETHILRASACRLPMVVMVVTSLPTSLPPNPQGSFFPASPCTTVCVTAVAASRRSHGSRPRPPASINSHWPPSGVSGSGPAFSLLIFFATDHHADWYRSTVVVKRGAVVCVMQTHALLPRHGLASPPVSLLTLQRLSTHTARNVQRW